MTSDETEQDEPRRSRDEEADGGGAEDPPRPGPADSARGTDAQDLGLDGGTAPAAPPSEVDDDDDGSGGDPAGD